MHIRRHLRALLALLLGLAGTALVAPGATAAAGSNVLLPGESLTAGQSLAVPAPRIGAEFDLDMQADGNLVLYEDFGGFRDAAWSSQTQGNPGARAVMQADGNLVVYAANGQPLWHTQTHGSPGASLTLQADGNLVVYSAGRALWQSGSYVLINSLEFGDRLLLGQDLVTEDERYRVIMQGDGNLVGYGPGGAYFWTGTQGHPGASLVMQGDGNLVLYDADNRTPLWSTGTQGTEALFAYLWPGGTLMLIGGENGFRSFWEAPGPEPIPDDDGGDF